jgi:hypothetical protein
LSEPETDSNSGLFSNTPGKKMAALVAIVIVGGFFGVQAMFGFPIRDLIRSGVTDQAKVVIKSGGTCIVIGSDQHPRSIPNRPYKVGDILVVTYKQGTVSIEKYQLKT